MSIPNWETASPLLCAWWDHETTGPVAQVTAPREGAPPSGFDWWSLVKPDADRTEILAAFEAWVDRTWFGGAAVPNMFFNMGPGILAACFSDHLEYRPDSGTVWFERAQPWEVVEQYSYQPRGHWMNYIRENMSYFLHSGRDNHLLGMTDLGGSLDILASLRGGEQLVTDLLLEPERVNALRKRILAAWIEAFADLYQIIQRRHFGNAAWMGIWAPGAWYPLQCDFSAMISPDMFGDFVAPDLAEQARWLDYSIYHLDGPGQIPHLDHLLAMPEIDGIQWVPGAGHPQNESKQWYPLYERILERDKLLVLQCWEDMEQIPRLLRDFPSGRILCSLTAETEEEGKRMLEWFG